DWKKVEDADAYEVYRDDEKIDTVKDNEYEDEKIATSYEEEPEYVVKAINGSDILQVSLPNSILIETSGNFDDSFLEAEDETEDNSPQTSIDPPENLEYEYTTDDTIVLTWDSVPEAEQYRITKNGVEIATTKDEKYEDNDYHDEYITSYIYSVTAVGEDTESEPSEEVMFESEQKKFLLGEILSNMGSFCGWLFS